MGDDSPGGAVGSRPTVIVDELHVEYRLVARRSRSNAAANLLGALTGKGGEQVVSKVHAVRGVSFTAYEGEAVGLIGTNGSGKSTLLRAMAGLLPAASGACYTRAKPTLMGVNAALLPDLTGERNIILGCLALGMTPEEAEAAKPGIIEFADIGEAIARPMSTYSSGMGARLRFAIAAAREHDILLIDEALATGDAPFRRRSERRINELRSAAGTVFLVSHGLGVVRATCNRGIWLEAGEIVMDGGVDEVCDAYEAKYDPSGT